MQDETIVQLYFERNEDAIKETQIKYDKYLTKIAYNILSDYDDSRESVNDTYLAAWNSIPPHKPISLSAYLGKITRRLSIDIFRKRNRDKRKASQYSVSLSELEECIPGYETPEMQLENMELAEMLNKFLRELPKDARNVFIGRYYYLDSIRNVAGYCGMTEGKVKSLLFRTRCKLRDYLKKEGIMI